LAPEGDRRASGSLPPWLALYLVGLAAATLSPFRLATCEPLRGLAPHLSVFDMAGNLLLFLPFGVALGRSGPWLVLCSAIALSGSIELAQGWLPRVQSGVDVAMNGAGALLGRALAPALPLPSHRALRAALAVSAPLAVLSLAGSIALRAPLDFSNWEPFPLWLHNEGTGDRPWRGELHDLRIYDHEIVVTSAAEDQPPRWAEGGPVLWLRPGEPGAARLDGPEGAREVALDLSRRPARADGTSASGTAVDGAVAAHLLERLRASGRLGVRLRVTTSEAVQSGPARIVSLSATTRRRNFTVAQVDGDVLVRVRTPATGPNGSPPDVRTRRDPLRTRPQWIGASFDGESLRIAVDGECDTEAILAISTAPVLIGALLAPALAGTVGLVALAAAMAARRRGSTLRWTLFAGGGLAAWGLLRVLGAWSHVYGFDPAALGIALVALGASIPCVRTLLGGAGPSAPSGCRSTEGGV
jgi:hypothetical protein